MTDCSEWFRLPRVFHRPGEPRLLLQTLELYYSCSGVGYLQWEVNLWWHTNGKTAVIATANLEVLFPAFHASVRFVRGGHGVWM